MKKVVLLSIAVLLSASYATGQKIKYKDLFFLLDTKKYDDAEPFLKEFLNDGKNGEHPNANFQMGVLYQEKSKKNDLLKDTDGLLANMDSAVIFYRKALTLIDEKEVKRNDDFYLAYKRRDVRSGKFGIKLADIQFDIENKITGINNQKNKVSELKNHHTAMMERYAAAQQRFADIQASRLTEKILLLRADADILQELQELKKDYLLAVDNFNNYKSSVGKVAIAGYDQSLKQTELLNYNTEGKSSTDYYADIITFWNYSKWSEDTQERINKIIFPLREKIVAHDKSLNSLYSTMINDSISVAKELNLLTDNSIATQLQVFDPEPLPIIVFGLKKAELIYSSIQMGHFPYMDSLDVIYQLDVINRSLNALNTMDSLTNLLVGKNLAEEYLNYKYYIDTQLGGEAGLQAFVKKKLDFTIDQKRLKNAELEAAVERSRWLISENDSIPLFETNEKMDSKYLPIAIDDNMTSGLLFLENQSVKGYFATIGPTRIPKVKVDFDIAGTFFTRENCEDVGAAHVTDETGHIYYSVLYVSKPEEESYAAIVSKIYTADGLSWTKSIDLAAAPVNFSYNQSTGDFTIAYKSGEGVADLIIDKKGNPKK